MKKLVYILMAVLFISCNNNTAPKPERLLDRDEMINILYDIALMEAIKSFEPAALHDNNVDAHTYIYKKYDIDSLTFAQNHLYYASDIEGYARIEKKVKNKIRETQDIYAPVAVKDTIAKQ